MLKSDLHSTLQLYAPTFVASLVQSPHWTVVLQLIVILMLVVEVAVELYVLAASPKVTLLGVQVVCLKYQLMKVGEQVGVQLVVEVVEKVGEQVGVQLVVEVVEKVKVEVEVAVQV